MFVQPQTIRPLTPDRPLHQGLDSPVVRADRLRSLGRGPSARGFLVGRGGQQPSFSFSLAVSIHSLDKQFRLLRD
jgi:hypothetical protein